MRLILSRHVGEEIVVGPPDNPIGYIRIGKPAGRAVRLHFDFPRTMEINRREVAEKKTIRPLPPFGTLAQ